MFLKEKNMNFETNKKMRFFLTAFGLCLATIATAALKPALRAADPNEGTFYNGSYYYEIISKADKTVRFAIDYINDATPYSGDVVVPAKVSNDGSDYTVVEIGKFCFDDDAVNLKSVKLPSTIRKIDEWSFYGSYITELDLPAGLQEIETNAFCNSNLKSLSIPGSCVKLGKEAFQDNKQLDTLIVGEGIDSISTGLFSGCIKLKKVTLPTTLHKISQYAFYECSSLDSISIPESVDSIGKYAFAKCEKLDHVIVPNSVKYIEKGILIACTSLTDVTLPEGFDTLPEETFSYCASLPKYKVNEGVKIIGKRAFEYCLSLSEVTISKDVTALEEAAFDKCSALSKIYCECLVPPTGADFPSNVYTDATLYVPEKAVELYRQAEGWKKFSKIEVDPNMSGVDLVHADGVVEAEYYNLNGVRVNDPTQAGIYIKRMGSKIIKVLVK